jgi:hypothetical protein
MCQSPAFQRPRLDVRHFSTVFMLRTAILSKKKIFKKNLAAM